MSIEVPKSNAAGEPKGAGLSATDFLNTRPDAMKSCNGKASGTGSLDAAMRAIRSAISDNLACLAITAAIVGVSMSIVWYVANTLIGVFKEWHKHQMPGPARPEKTANKNLDDDVVYGDEVVGDDGIPSDLGPAPTAPLVAARMARLATQYAPYNAAMRSRAVANGVAPDDLVDARILGRKDDDWRYARSGRRNGGGGGGGGYALRSPLYTMGGG